MALLDVRDLQMSFPAGSGEARAVDGVSFTLERGQVLGLVGESGCGKSMTALCLLRLVPPPGRITGGQVLFQGRDLLALPEREMRGLRGSQIAMIFQEPMTSLNPVLHRRQPGRRGGAPAPQGVARRRRAGRAVELLGEVGIPDARRARRGLPAPALGRHAAAGDDRDGARVRARAADRRRAHHRARRHHPGADPRPPADAAASARHERSSSSRTISASSPSRPTRSRHVRRPDRRARRRRRPLRARRAIPTRQALLRSMPRSARDVERLAGDPRPGAEPDATAERLPLPRPLPDAHRRAAPRSRAAAGEHRALRPLSRWRHERARAAARGMNGTPLVEAARAPQVTSRSGAACSAGRAPSCAPSRTSTLDIAAGRDARPGRRVGLRQVDARPPVLRLLEPTARRRRVRRADSLLELQRARAAPLRRRMQIDLPGPVRRRSTRA